ncbi:hypothetical protein ACFYPC_16515 [Streptomyces sp. NPDC005808]|uniref:hypothetical protein n=1 Tax=Streptomyces sp. NPDC005808 TaxID=3364734 RepID=UPI0036B03902
MNWLRASALATVAAIGCGLVVAGPAAADSTDCRDWWTINDTDRTVFTDSTHTLKFWGHRSCGDTSTPQYWMAVYQPDESSDESWDRMKSLHGNDPGAVAYGYEMHWSGSGWVATGFAASHG